MVTHHRLRPLRTLLPAPGTSTKWPGATRYALYMPLLSTLLGILQVILGAILLSKVRMFRYNLRRDYKIARLVA